MRRGRRVRASDQEDREQRSHCPLICTFELGCTLQRGLAGFTLERLGNTWSTTHESTGCPAGLTMVQATLARTPWLLPALTVSMQGLWPLSTTSPRRNLGAAHRACR